MSKGIIMNTKTWKLTALDNFGGGIVALYDTDAEAIIFAVKAGTPNAARSIVAWKKRNKWASECRVIEL